MYRLPKRKRTPIAKILDTVGAVFRLIGALIWVGHQLLNW